MENPILILHGWSDDASTFRNLAKFFEDKLNRQIEDINLGDWISLDDEVTLRDLGVALDRAWTAKGLPRTNRSIDVVTHSTGSLLIREWLTNDPGSRTAQSNPIKRLLMLAPANFGSPLAHKGRAFYGRIVKGWRTGFQTGTQILKALELGSPYTWQLAEKDIFSAHAWYGKNRIMATTLVGDTGFSGVAAAANEDGSDGTVRVSTANMNAAKVTIDLSKPNQKPKWEIPTPQRACAFGVMHGDNHGTITMSKDNTPVNPEAPDLMLEAITVRPSEWDAFKAKLEGITAKAGQARFDEDGKLDRDGEYHAFQNTVTYASDDLGQDVSDYFVEISENNTDELDWLGKLFHRDALRTVHAYKDRSAFRSLYVDVSRLKDDLNNPKDTLSVSVVAEPRLDSDHDKRTAGFISHERDPIILDKEHIERFFQEHRTLLVHIIIERAMSEDLVFIANREDPRINKGKK